MVLILSSELFLVPLYLQSLLLLILILTKGKSDGGGARRWQKNPSGVRGLGWVE